jgi:hypothetical protein
VDGRVHAEGIEPRVARVVVLRVRAVGEVVVRRGVDVRRVLLRGRVRGVPRRWCRSERERGRRRRRRSEDRRGCRQHKRQRWWDPGGRHGSLTLAVAASSRCRRRDVVLLTQMLCTVHFGKMALSVCERKAERGRTDSVSDRVKDLSHSNKALVNTPTPYGAVRGIVRRLRTGDGTYKRLLASMGATMRHEGEAGCLH